MDDFRNGQKWEWMSWEYGNVGMGEFGNSEMWQWVKVEIGEM